MRQLLAVAVVAVAGLSVGAAAPKPAEVWSCWHSISGDKEGASPIELVRDGGVVKVRGSEFIEYTVLQDNEFGLIAARGYSEKLDDTKDLGADVFVIDKKKREIHLSNLAVEGARAEKPPQRGKCELK